MGLMTSFGVGVTGLSAAQNALNTTAHNLTNTDTKGYVRQQIVMVDNIYRRQATASKMDQAGLGTMIEKIRQVRDRFLDASFRRETGRKEFYRAQAETVKELEDLYGELEGTTFQSTMSDLWRSIQELRKEPESIVARTSLVENAVTFIERTESIVGQMKKFRLDLNVKIKNTVDRANEIAHQIHDLNGRIRRYEADHQSANDYRDERNKLLDELGSLARISYKELNDGSINVNLEGTQFVTEFGVNEMAARESEDGLKIYTPTWPYDTDETGKEREVFNLDVVPKAESDTDIGYLKGLLLARGKNQGRYTDIPKEPDPAHYEEGENDEYYIEAMKAYREALYIYENQIAPSLMVNTEAEFDQLIHGVTTLINEVLAPNLTATFTDGGEPVWRDSNGRVLTEEEKPDIDVGNFEDHWVKERDALGNETGRFTLTILDSKKAPVSMNTEKRPGVVLFERKGIKRYTEIEDGDKKVYLYNSEKYDPKDEDTKYSLFSMGEIMVNQEVRNNVSLLPMSYNTDTGDFSHDVAEKLSAIWSKPFSTLNPSTMTKNNFSDYYAIFTSEIANTGQTMRAIAKSQEVTERSVDNQRQQVLGTNSDEELTHMIKFQQHFNAASRYITVIDEMLEHLVTSLG